MSRDPKDFPTAITVSEPVAEAIVTTYARLHGMDEVAVRECFHGGVPFDSILGIELASAVEETLLISIAEKHLMNTEIYQSLAAFAVMVQKCVNERESVDKRRS